MDRQYQSLESRVRRWLSRPPLFRPECPACRRATISARIGHGRGCFVVAYAKGQVEL